MRCEEFSDSLAREGANLSREAREHLRTCPHCRRLLETTSQLSASTGPAGLPLDRWTATLTSATVAAPPLAGSLWYVLGFLGVAAAVAAAGILILGTRGWHANEGLPRIWYSLGVACAALASAAVLSSAMVPGSLLRIRQGILTAFALLWFAAIGLFYPLEHYPHFWRTTLGCLAIGLTTAGLASSLAWLVLRRGFVTNGGLAAFALGQLAGTSALAMQFVYCPHTETGHFALAHFGAYLISSLAAPLAVYRLLRR